MSVFSEAAKISRLAQLHKAAEAEPKKRVTVSPSYTSRQENHLDQDISPMKKIYLDWENKKLRKLEITVKIQLSFADQPHSYKKEKCGCHAKKKCA